MSEPITPLPPSARRVLEAALPPRPPRGAADRVFARLQASIAAPPPPPAAPAPAAPLIKVGLVTLLVGLCAGVLLTRAAFAPAPLPPIIVVRTFEKEVLVPAPERPEPLSDVKPKAKPKQPEPTAEIDAKLARERELVDTARSALMRGSAADALAPLRTHEAEFSAGRLAEERESLWIQALVLEGQLEAAKKRAAQFHLLFPRSLLGATVDAAISEP